MNSGKKRKRNKLLMSVWKITLEISVASFFFFLYSDISDIFSLSFLFSYLGMVIHCL